MTTLDPYSCTCQRFVMSVRMKVFALQVFFCTCFLATVSSDYIPVIVEESGAEDVEKFATVIHFYVDLINNGKESIKVTVSPNECCVTVEEGDVDCEVIELRPPVTLTLGPRVDQFAGNNSGRAQFMFRNLYTRFRKGSCTFQVSGGKDVGFKHTLEFDTTPDDFDASQNCTGIDQDPDRDCSPSDCAIKYKGHRNFYRNATGKCEPVVHCNTKGGRDGSQTVAYYDWDSNVCNRLDVEDNTFSQIESAEEIPADIDPSQSVYFPNLEPQRLKSIADGKEKLECNNGVQNGVYCDCNDGWMSSGIHEEDPMTFHWCDARTVDRSTMYGRPVRLSKPVEIFYIIILSLVNISLFALWLYLSYFLFLKERCKRACAKHQEPSYTLLEPN